MCGIFGVCVREGAELPAGLIDSTVRQLFILSESRGKEAAGVAVVSGDTIEVFKEPLPASRLIRQPGFKAVLQQATGTNGRRGPSVVVGHSRLVTDGCQADWANNQPVIAGELVGVHNGIIVNVDRICRRFPQLERSTEVDSEVILLLLRHFLDSDSGADLAAATRSMFEVIEGMASIAVLAGDRDTLLLGTNNGSLYLCTSESQQLFMFASEAIILDRLIARNRLERRVGRCRVEHLQAGRSCIVDLASLDLSFLGVAKGPAGNPLRREAREIVPDVLIGMKPQVAGVAGVTSRLAASANRADGAISRAAAVLGVSGRASSEEQPPPSTTSRTRSIVAHRPLATPPAKTAPAPRHQPVDVDAHYRQLLPAVRSIRRCTRCILPVTMPFIELDADGVCNYCRFFQEIRPKGDDALEALLARHRSNDPSRPDCVVGLSGGRDSTFGLHVLKTVHGMTPVAYTYDWGMVTDLARRNISRICGKLGIEHILISADIARKRRYIRSNVLAWLRRPDLGIIPLFMAGDKQYFYYAEKIKRQLGVQLLLQCENRFEDTDFKSGFSGIRPSFAEKTFSDELSWLNKVRIAWYYGSRFLGNPWYLNSSLPDTAFAYYCYYFVRSDYVNLFDYLPWDEDTVVGTIRNEYDWELATDTEVTWRIGDGTASFYNYIYWTMGGFTENDCFRSTQVRHGIISREEAAALAEAENRPRLESMQWYCRTINIDLDQALQVIHRAPKLYAR